MAQVQVEVDQGGVGQKRGLNKKILVWNQRERFEASSGVGTSTSTARPGARLQISDRKELCSAGYCQRVRYESSGHRAGQDAARQGWEMYE